MLRREARVQLRGPSVIGGDSPTCAPPTTASRSGSAACARSACRATGGLRHVPDGPPRRGPRAGASPPRAHINKPLWESPPAGIQDTLTTTAVRADSVFVTRVRKKKGTPPVAAVLQLQR